MKRFLSILYILFTIAMLSGCKKDSFITGSGATLATSEDSLHFDTLFTTTGSVTHFFKVYNTNDQKLRITAITLSGGSSSYFRINADGRAGPQVTDLEVDANDSLYVFVTVKIDPSSTDLPFIVQDSINIAFNGNQKWVRLRAWGQNAVFISSKVITGNTTWLNNKPVVILGGALIAEGATLNIEKGTRIYLHADAPILVDGTIQAIGEKFDSTKIIFQGDRLDDYYKDHPGSWPGIYFREKSIANHFKQVIIKNAYQGLIVEKPASDASSKLVLEECIIDNCYDAGILGVGSSIRAVNCVVSNCGKNIQLIAGGEYEFVNCTSVAISNSYISHRQPVLAVTNFIKQGNDVIESDLAANFTNCIFWGDNGLVENEVVVVKEGNSSIFEVDFVNCLWKLVDTPEAINSSGIIANEDPLFREINTADRIYNFRLKEGSPAIDAGVNTSVLTDLDGNERVNNPDAGAYETDF